MTVTTPTAPFDLGNGQHGIIVEGEDACDHNAPRSHPNARVNDCCYTQPPRWVLDALEPCGCVRRGQKRYVDWHLWDTTIEPTECKRCHGGEPVVQFQVHCDQSCDVFPCRRVNVDCSAGLRSAGRWTVTEALPMLLMSDTPVIPCIQMADDGTAYRLPDVPGESLIQILPHIQEVTIPGDPADLIGKYLVIVKAVA